MFKGILVYIAVLILVLLIGSGIIYLLAYYTSVGLFIVGILCIIIGLGMFRLYILNK